jgi:tight adherence protein B
VTAFLLLAGAGLILAAALLAGSLLRARRQAGIILSERLGLLVPAAIAVPAAEVPWFDWARARIPAFLQRDIARADVEITARAVILYGALLPLAAVAGGLAVGVSGAVAAVLLGIVGPALYIRFLANRRLAAFTDLLPHYLDSIRQLLLVGNSFQQALAKSTDGSSPPIQRYLQPAMRRIGNGAPVVDALEMVADRIDLPEWHMVVAAVRTNARFGGSVAPTLAGVVRLLRDRARVVRELGAASAETRMSAMVLCALPPVALLIISLINYGYMRYLWETAAGRHLLAIGLAFQTTGMLTMRRLMRLDF